MPKLTKRAIHYGWTYGRTDPNYRKASFLKKVEENIGGGVSFFLGTIYLGRVIVINLPRTYRKILCKGEPYRFNG